MAVDRAVDQVAGRQAGAFNARQVGAYRQLTHRRLSGGVWVRSRFPGVLLLPSHPPSWLQDLWCAFLWAGPSSAISHRAAAALLGLVGFDPGPIELTVPPGRKHRMPRGRLHQSSLEPSDARVVDGLRRTSPERTLVDLAALRLRPDHIEDAVESAFSQGLTTPGRMLASLDGRPGTAVVRALLEGRGDGRPRDSKLEGMFERLVVAAGLPRPERQHNVGRYRVDFAYPERRTAIELDGDAKLRTKQAREAFLRRQTDISALGWTFLRFTWSNVVDRPEWVLACLRQALEV